MNNFKKKSWKGNCNLDFFNINTPSESYTKTICKSKFSSPYKLLKSKYDEEGRCILPILHTAGGLVGGDQLNLQLNISNDSKALITTTSAQKVYGSIGRSKLNPQGLFASQVNNIKISENSHLEFLPQETIVFANSLFSQETKVTLSNNSSFIFSDLVRIGRSSIGETLDKGIFKSRIEILRDTPCIEDWEFVDQIQLSDLCRKSKSGMDNMPVFGSFIWICDKEFPKIKIEKLISQIKKIFLNSESEFSIGYLENGISIRFLGNSTQEARNCFFYIWKQIRCVSSFCMPKYQGVWPLQDQMNY